MRTLNEGKDWLYIIPEDEGTTIHLKLLSGEYSGTVYQYGKVQTEEAPDGALYLKFIYNIVETPFDKTVLENSDDFKNYIGDVLVNIMSQNLEEGTIDETGTSYSEESDNE
jgi:hypothetical protein